MRAHFCNKNEAVQRVRSGNLQMRRSINSTLLRPQTRRSSRLIKTTRVTRLIQSVCALICTMPYCLARSRHARVVSVHTMLINQFLSISSTLSWTRSIRPATSRSRARSSWLGYTAAGQKNLQPWTSELSQPKTMGASKTPSKSATWRGLGPTRQLRGWESCRNQRAL